MNHLRSRVATRRSDSRPMLSPVTRRRNQAAFCLTAISLLHLPGGFCQAPVLTRDGVYWTRTSSGASTCATGRFRLYTRGSIVLRGQANNTVQYTFKQHAKARDEADAKRRLGVLTTRSIVERGWCTLTLLPPDRDETTSELEINVPRSLREANLDTRGGNIEAFDIDGMLLAQTAAGTVHLDRIGSSAVAKTGGGEIQIGVVGGSLRCLSGGGAIHVDTAKGETWCETAGGDITLRQALGPLHASTNGGNISVVRAGSTVSARSAGGLIDVQQAGGMVRAETRGGSIQVGSSNGAACESAAGTIRVKSVSGALRVSTAMGSILAELLSSNRFEDSFLNTGSGDITVLIPSKIAVSVLARNETPGNSGRIVSDFPEIRVSRAILQAPGPVLAEGALNGGGPVLRIVASGGSIYLRRQKQ